MYLAWTTAVNIMSAGGIPDTTILLVVLIVFIVGFTISFVVIDRRIGIACLAIAGGLSLGIRIVLLRDGLLFSIFFLNWAFVAFLGVTGGFIVVYCERLGVVSYALSQLGRHLHLTLTAHQLSDCQQHGVRNIFILPGNGSRCQSAKRDIARAEVPFRS
jgi:hypothetical protein